MMSNTHTTNETLFTNKPYQLMRDLVPVAPVNSSDLVMVVHPSVPAKTLQEFIALAKAQPGKLSYASSGPGTPYHMAGELFKAMTGTDILHVPHKSSGEARNDVHGRPCPDDVRRRHHDEGPDRGQRSARARHHRPQALGHAAQRADHRRIGRAGLRGDDLARHHGAQGHAARRSSTS